jgi:hypothetical protein
MVRNHPILLLGQLPEQTRVVPSYYAPPVREQYSRVCRGRCS